MKVIEDRKRTEHPSEMPVPENILRVTRGRTMIRHSCVTRKYLVFAADRAPMLESAVWERAFWGRYSP